MSKIANILQGATLIKNDSAETSTVEQIFAASNNKKKYLLLYFSASWCPPCQRFTPQLIDFYNKNHDDKQFEIVFVTSDQDEAAFQKYFSKMPFFALEFTKDKFAASTNKKLGAHFKIEGIPSLIVLERTEKQGEADYEFITDLGVEQLLRDEKGDQFPWKPKSLQECLGDRFLTSHNATETSQVDLSEYEAVGLYFSAHWCPPCRGTTPLLTKAFQAVNQADNKKFQVIFVSSDQGEEQFKKYFEEMPWMAIPLTDERVELLSSHFKVQGIPALVIFDPKTHKIINDNAVGLVRQDTAGEQFPWATPAVETLSPMVAGEHFNEHPCLILFSDKVSEEQRKENGELLKKLAEKYVSQFEEQGLGASSRPLYFIHATDTPIITQVRTFCGVVSEPGTFAVIFQVSNNFKSILKDVSFEKLDQAVKDFIADSLEGEPMFNAQSGEVDDDDENDEDDEALNVD